MLKWAKMTNPQTQRELKRLEIDIREEQLHQKPGGRRLQGRTITSASPLPPPQSSSYPPITAQIPPTINHSSLNQRDSTTLLRNYFEQNPGLPGGLNITDANSISQWLQFATEQLKKETQNK